MAKQNRPIIWEVTIGFISFYKRCGVGCVRMKSNLTAERWRKDPAFEGSRESAACMALASPLASAVYQTIPEQQRVYPHYKQLVGIAQHMLCQGYNIPQVNKVLRFAVARYLRKLHATDPNRIPERSPFAATLSLKVNPAFKTAIPHQWTVPQFTTATISRSLFRGMPLILPPRGSPATFGGTPKTGTLPVARCNLPATTRQCSGSIPVEASHSQWQGLLFPYPPIQSLRPQNRPQKHQKNTPENNFLPSGFSIAA